MATTIQPYVFFDGNCADAIAFYKEAFDAEVSVMTFADAPMDIPPGFETRVMHGTLKFGDAIFFVSDGMPGQPIDEGMRANLSIATDTAAEGKLLFDKLADGGEVTMAYEKQFWGDTFGMLTDRFGIKWMVNASAE